MFTKSSNIHRLTCSFKLATIGCRFVLVCMTLETNPANICWSLRHILKTSSIRLQRNNFSSSKTSWRRLEDVLKTSHKTSWRRLEGILEDEKLLRWRRIEDVLKTCLEDVLKTCLEDVLKTCLEDVLKTCLEDVCKTSWRQTKCFLKLSVSNKSKCVSNKSGISQTYIWRI